MNLISKRKTRVTIFDNSLALQAQEDNDKLRKEMDNRINALKAFELEQAKQKAEELKKEQDDMLKYTKRLKNVGWCVRIFLGQRPRAGAREGRV